MSACDTVPTCRCGSPLKTSPASRENTADSGKKHSDPNKSPKVPPAIARILCEKCNPAPGDDTLEISTIRHLLPERRQKIRRSVSCCDSVAKEDIGRVRKLSISSESILSTRRKFVPLEPIHDAV